MKKQNSAMKKIISLVLGLVMVMGLAMPVMADWVILNPNGEPYYLLGREGQDTENSPTFQVTLVSDEPIRHWDMEEHILQLPLGTQLIIELFPASQADVQLETTTVELAVFNGNATKHEHIERAYDGTDWLEYWYEWEFDYITLLDYNRATGGFITGSHRIVHILDEQGTFYIRSEMQVSQPVQHSGGAFTNAMADDGREVTLFVGGGTAPRGSFRQIEEQSTPSTPSEIPNLNTASTWAQEGIAQAFNLGLIPQSLQNSYTANATRAEFSAFAVALYETATGREITGRMQFNDTTDVNVQKMGYLGIVTGVGDGNFAPSNGITREQAAVMIARLVDAIAQPLSPSAPTFADNSQISSWAMDAVGQVQAAGIMGGVGNNQFAPNGDYTREQSIITMLRVFELVN